jgi:hypothetical protein
MPSWCRQVNWGNCGIPWVICVVLCVKDNWKDSSEACAIACQNCAVYSVFPSATTLHSKIAQFNWQCKGRFKISPILRYSCNNKIEYDECSYRSLWVTAVWEVWWAATSVFLEFTSFILRRSGCKRQKRPKIIATCHNSEDEDIKMFICFPWSVGRSSHSQDPSSIQTGFSHCQNTITVPIDK